MLAGGGALWPAGSPMTLRKFLQCVNYSVSPIAGIDASPLFGTASATQDQEVDAVAINNDAPREVADQDQREEFAVPDVPWGFGDEVHLRFIQFGCDLQFSLVVFCQRGSFGE